MLSSAGIHHVALRTRDVPRLETFYAEVLGLERVPTPAAPEGREPSVWLAAGTTLIMIERAESSEPEVPRGSMELTAFAIDPPMRAECTARLAARGVQIEGETAFTVYFRDPDGRRVGISHYPEPRA